MSKYFSPGEDLGRLQNREDPWRSLFLLASLAQVMARLGSDQGLFRPQLKGVLVSRSRARKEAAAAVE